MLYRAPSTWAAGQYGYKEEDNHEFSDQFEYSGYSGSHIIFTSVITNRVYHMFMSDFHNMMLAKKMNNNIIEGTFVFTKKGTVQGFKMLLPKESADIVPAP